MWGLWIYLFLPLLNIVLRVMGGHYFYESVLVEENRYQFLTMVKRVWLSILIVFLTMRGWGFYNYYRFGRLERRKSRSNITKKELADYFEITEEEVLSLQSQKEIQWDKIYTPENQKTK